VIKTGKYQFLLNVLLSGLNWICKFSVITVLLMGFDIPTQPVTFFLFQWIILVIMTIMPTPGGAGGAETTFYFMFSSFVPGGILGIVTAGWRFITFYFLLIVCSLLFLILGAHSVGRRLQSKGSVLCLQRKVVSGDISNATVRY
jgi:uncharacterized protein (TIRG00374 family)